MANRIGICVVSELRLEFIHMLRYKEWVFAALLYPVIFASIPILLGTWLASGSEEASRIFAANIGTEAYSIFLLAGANMWFFVMTALWDFGLKLRREQSSGVIEDVYLAAGKLTWPLLGSGLFGFLQCIGRYVISMLIGSILYGTVRYILGLNFLFSVLVLAVGLVGVYGLSFLVGALVLKFKEAFSLMVLLQMLFGFLMGVFYPVSLLPSGLRELSYALPMTIALNDIRASLLATPYVLNVYLDLLLMALQSAAYILIGLFLLRRSEVNIRRGVGLASF